MALAYSLPIFIHSFFLQGVPATGRGNMRLDVNWSPDKVKKNAGDGIVSPEISDDSGIESKAVSDDTAGEVMDTIATIEIKEDIVTDNIARQKKIMESHL